MKKSNFFFAAMAFAVAVVMGACTPKNDPALGPGAGQTEENGGENTVVTWDDVKLPDGAITVAQAIEIGEALGAGGTTDKEYYVYGIVKKNSTTAETVSSYGNMNFYMIDSSEDTKDFEAFQVYNVGNQKFTAPNQIEVGDRVIVFGKITNYNGTQIETTGKGSAYVYWTDNKNQGGGNNQEDPEGVVGKGTQAEPYTVADLILLNGAKTGNFYVKGFIVGQVKAGAQKLDEAEFLPPYSATESGDNTNILIAAAAGETDKEKCAPVQLPAGFLRDALNLPKNPSNLGAEVVLYGSLEKYFGKAGVKNISKAWINGKEVELPTGEAPEATKVTVAEFNAAPVNSTLPGVWYELTGTIVDNSANGNKFDLATYGNFDLQDATGSVYVYGLSTTYVPLSSASKGTQDKKVAELGLKVGDVITIRGVRGAYNDKIEVIGAYIVK